MPNRRRSGAKLVTSSPSTRMRPESGVSNPAVRRRIVVFPLPDGPSRATISPFSADSDTSRVTGSSPKRFSSESSSRNPVIDGTLSAGSRSGSPAADRAIPRGHPFGALFFDEVPVHVGDDHVAVDFASPCRQLLAEVRARGKPVRLRGRESLHGLGSEKLDQRASRLGMLAAGDEADRVVDDRRAALRKDVLERRAALALEKRVGEIPDRDEAFLADDLFVEEDRIEDVLLGLRVETLEPREAGVGRAGLLDRAREDESPDGAHRARGERIADE